MDNVQSLPVRVRNDPHWRVLMRPSIYEDERIKTLGRCWELIEQKQVRLRGWPFPFLSNREHERAHGSNWVGSWSDFRGHREYWRLYQSGQFIHLSGIREATDPEWHAKLQRETKGHLSYVKDIDWNAVGFIHITNFIYTVTEVFEFAARMAQANTFGTHVEIAVQLNGVKGFMLTTDWDRAWHSYYAASEDSLAKTWELSVNDLVSDTATRSLDAVFWFFDRFGWHNPPVEVLRQDQSDYLTGRR